MIFIINNLIEIVLTIVILILLIYGAITEHLTIYKALKSVNFLSILSIFITLILLINSYNICEFSSFLDIDSISEYKLIFFFKFLILSVVFIILIILNDLYKLEKIESFEFPILILTSTLGLLILISSENFMTFYLSLELQSLSLYVLCGFKSDKNSSSEAALKYFIVGSVSSGILLFGISLIYGFVGTLNFSDLTIVLHGMKDFSFNNKIGLELGLVCVLIGLFFKLAIVPFHLWLSDIYNGILLSTLIFIATVPKLGLICILIKYIYIIFLNTFFAIILSNILLVVSFLSVFIGSLGALAQTKIRGLIAYSSIANMGYILLPLAFITFDNNILSWDFIFIILWYTLIYIFTLVNLFSIISNLFKKINNFENKSFIYLSELSGLYKSNKLLAIFFCLSLFSLIGVPPLLGFFSKFLLFLFVVNNNLWFVALIFFFLSVISSFYYLRIIKIIVFNERNMVRLIPIPYKISLVIVLTSILIIFFFFKPVILNILYFWLFF